MNPTDNPTPPPTDDVQWFAQSERTVDGRPDTRYGWLARADGPCIVKAIDPALGPTLTEMIGHERAALAFLNQRRAPVPQLVGGYPDHWMVTRFAGLSLKLLATWPGAAAALPPAERGALWAHFLRRAQVFVDIGALPLDIWDGNVVCPLTDTTQGRLRLNEPVMIDHAHTVCSGMDLRRPLWISARMERVPPEVRPLLVEDQDELRAAFRREGLLTPDHTEARQDAEQRSLRLWRAYEASQRLLEAIERGTLDIGAAIQYAVGVALRPHAGTDLQAQVAERMQAQSVADRYPSLEKAAVALAATLPRLPLVGAWECGPIGPADLSPGAGVAAPAAAAGTPPLGTSAAATPAWAGTLAAGRQAPPPATAELPPFTVAAAQTAVAAVVVPAEGPQALLADKTAPRAPLPWLWMAMAAAAGAGVGWAWPL